VGTLGLLVLVVFQADFQLTDGFVNSLDRLDAMAAEVVSGMFEMLLGIAQRLESFVDLRMLWGRRGGRRGLSSGCGIGRGLRVGGDGREGHRQQQACSRHKLAIVLEIFMDRYLLNYGIQITKWRRR